MTALQAVSEPGRRAVLACQKVAPTLQELAGDADRSGCMSEQSFAALRQAGILAAFVPESLGGMGLSSAHDWALVVSELARADASVAIAANMHMGATRGMSIAYQANGAGEAVLTAVAAGQMMICATATERGTDNLHPLTEATRSEDGWVVNGAKMFVTSSPLATHLAMNVRLRDEDGDHIASTMVPLNTPGIVQNDDWDALGMRGSGSQSITFTDVPVSSLRKIGPWGQWSIASLMNRAMGNLSLVGASLGIAESAYEAAVTAAGRMQRLDQPVKYDAGVQHLVAECYLELVQCRAVLEHTTKWVDERLEEWQGGAPDLASAHELMRAYQSAKSIVNGAAIRCVNKAMDVAGGSSFMAAHPLSRLYRDVRSAPFMQPGSPAQAREYIGRVSLGILPES